MGVAISGKWQKIAWMLVLVAAVFPACRSAKPITASYTPGLPTVGGARFAQPVNLPVPSYAQRDPAWAGDRLGKSHETIGSAGCTMCCVSMLLSYYGYKADPKTLNDYLSAHEGYTGSGLLVWEKCVDFAGGGVQVAYIGEPDYAQIDRRLLKGEPSIVKIVTPRGVPHWVLVVGKHDREYTVMDPLNGPAAWPLSRYGQYMYALRVLGRAPREKVAERPRTQRAAE